MPNELAYGFIGLQQIFDQRVAELNIRVINEAIQQSLDEHNRQVNGLLDQVVTRVTHAQERFRLPGGGTLQPLDEWGNPIPVRVGEFQDIAFPIKGAGTAWGTNRVSREMMTVQEANELQVMVQQQDADWMRRHILASLLSNQAYQFGDHEVGTLTIHPLANGDSQRYFFNGGLQTANHYVGQADAISDANNPFPNIYATLSRYSGNNPPFVSYVATNLVADIQSLATFYPIADPDIAQGLANDRLTASGPGAAFGEEVLGKVDGVWIVTWNHLPDGYILTLAQGASQTALAMRQYPTPALQGLFPEEHSPDGNTQERRFLRYAGFGGRNRVAGMVNFVGNATYQVPAGLTTPLDV